MWFSTIKYYVRSIAHGNIWNSPFALLCSFVCFIFDGCETDAEPCIIEQNGNIYVICNLTLHFSYLFNTIPVSVINICCHLIYMYILKSLILLYTYICNWVYILLFLHCGKSRDFSMLTYYAYAVFIISTYLSIYSFLLIIVNYALRFCVFNLLLFLCFVYYFVFCLLQVF